MPEGVPPKKKGQFPYLNPAGRPKGAKDRIPRGTVKAVYQDLLESYNGHELMVEAAFRALNNKKQGTLAHRHMELAAKVLDRVDDAEPAVSINIHTNIDPEKLKVFKRPSKDGAK